jgi:hypothetical protein
MFRYIVLHCLTACKLKPLSGKNKIYTIYDKNSVDTRGVLKEAVWCGVLKKLGGVLKEAAVLSSVEVFYKTSVHLHFGD